MAVKTIEIDNLENNQLYGFRMFPRNLKGQYQTRDDRGTATATPVAFSLPTYTGNHTIFGDINEGRIEMYTSGTLTLSAGTYDMFAVGAGGSNKGINTKGSYGGAGGGYTKTVSRKNLATSTDINVFIGSPTVGDTGGKTIITGLIETNGGTNGNGFNGGNGGSGGGTYSDNKIGGNGGYDGADGIKSQGVAGIGQHTTTRAFGETTGTLYAGGGGGNGDIRNGTVGQGGGGGGGNGAVANNVGQNGTPNTGGGSGGAGMGSNLGGSGIAIIRWKNN